MGGGHLHHSHKQTVEGIFEIGRMLIAAKRALVHGEFERMIDRDLPFDASTAQRLMKIARDPRLRKAARVQVLPLAWGTLYELTKLCDTHFEQAVASGAINSQTTRDDVRSLRGNVVAASRTTVERPTISLPFYNRDVAPMRSLTLYGSSKAPDHQPPVLTVLPGIAALQMLRQIEHLVDELKAEVERGEVKVDAAFSLRIQSISDRLLATVSRRRSN